MRRAYALSDGSSMYKKMKRLKTVSKRETLEKKTDKSLYIASRCDAPNEKL